MKAYKKTIWVDGETPINASNLNKIETALGTLSETALTLESLESADDKITITSKDGKVQFGLAGSTLMTDSISSFNVVDARPTVTEKNGVYLWNRTPGDGEIEDEYTMIVHGRTANVRTTASCVKVNSNQTIYDYVNAEINSVRGELLAEISKLKKQIEELKNGK